MNKEILASLIDGEELYQNAPCGYFSLLLNGTIVKVNRTLLRWLGYPEEEVINRKKFTDLTSKGGSIYYEMVYMPSLKMYGHVNEINFDIFRKDGSSFPALLNSVIISDASGRRSAINVTIFDITDRKKYEKELLLARREAEAEKKRFEFLSDLIPEIIWTATAAGEFDYVNSRFYQYFGCSPADLSAQFLLSKIHRSDRARCLRTWIASINSGRDFECQLRLENSSKIFQWHLVRAKSYKEPDQPVIKWFGSSTNIDDQVTALQRKDEFINIASHELRTPITSLKLYNQILQRTVSPEKVNFLVEKSAATLSSLHFLVSSLFDVSQINSGQLTLDIASTSLNSILRYSIDLIKLNYPTHQIAEEFDSGAELYVKADPQRLTQVIINLLSNAIKYSPGAEKVTLKVNQNANGTLAKIEVTDYGMGIAPEKLDFVFDKYYRVSDTLSPNRVQGLGLGLYIIQNIIKRHGSRINVKSEVGAGSTFYFSLPITHKE